MVKPVAPCRSTIAPFSVEEYVASYTEGKGFDIVFDNHRRCNTGRCVRGCKAVYRSRSELSRMGNTLPRAIIFQGCNLFGSVYLIPPISSENRAHHGRISSEVAVLAEAGKLKPLLSEQRFAPGDLESAYSRVEEGSL